MANEVNSESHSDAAVSAMCDDLHKLRKGLAIIGVQAHLLDRVIEMLTSQAAEIERFRSERSYVVGHNDGWKAAFATGLPGDTEEEA